MICSGRKALVSALLPAHLFLQLLGKSFSLKDLKNGAEGRNPHTQSAERDSLKTPAVDSEATRAVGREIKALRKV